MCRTYHVTIYTPFLIVLLSSCYQAVIITNTTFPPITNDSSVNNESTETNFTTISTTTDLIFPDIQNLTAVAINSSSIKLTWQVSTGAPLLSEFIVIWTKLSNSFTSKNTTVNGTNEIVIENLDAWTEYQFIVAVLLKDNDLRYSANTTEKTEPSAPSQLKIHTTRTNTSIFVKWKEPIHPNGPLDGYIIILETEKDKNVKNNTYNRSITSHTFEGLNPWTNYTVILIAFNEWEGSKLETEVNETVETLYGAPSEPREFVAAVNSSRAILLSWNDPENPNGPLDGFRIICWRIRDNVSVNETNVGRDIKSYLFGGLAPWTNYSFTIVAYNSELLSEEATASERTAPEEPNNITDFKVSGRSPTSLNVTWSPPKEFPGPTNYTLTLFKLDRCNKKPRENVRTLENIGYNNSTAYFFKLEPYTKYIVDIRAATEVGNSLSLSLEEETLPDRPSIVRDVKDIKVNPTNISICWKIPEKPNGNIREFFISYVESKDKRYNSKIITRSHRECEVDPPSYNTTIDQLLPEHSYEFSIYAKVDDTKGGFISGKEENFIRTLPAGWPPFPKKNITIIEKSQRQITFELCNDTFSNSMGAIIKYAVIVGRAGHISDTPEQGDLNTTKLPTWYEFVNNKCTKEKKCTKYQATPNFWNPFNVNDDSVKCKPVGDSNLCKINYTLGYDIRCKNNNTNHYCNGPLRPGIRYSIKIRGYTNSGFAETPPICTETEPEEAQKPKSGIIVAVVVSLLFLMLLVTGFFIYKKFGIINRFFGKTVMETSTETNDISFMSVITKSRPVKLGAFASHVSSMMADSALRFSQEFEELKSISPTHSCSAAQMQENKLKNRWINILPFDHSRVKLLPMDDEPGSDYINASYIPGFNSHREYIATQGPLPNTVDDMWRMIWEHGISMIVMLTQCVERGKTKCEQYWPLEKEEATYGDLKVQTIHESILSDYIIRSFNVSLGEKQRVMTQMHFTKWPDFGCPENTELLINFVRTVRDRMIENDPNPMLVHCSAGVGRTGTFIAVNRLAKHIELYDVIDVFHIVLDMRQHRTNMVQTEDQYIYIHECVRDLIQEKFARNNESYKNDETYGNLGNHTTNI